MSHESIFLCGRATAIFAASQDVIVPATGQLVIDGEFWLIPRAMKLRRLHLAQFTAGPNLAGLTVRNLKFNNHTTIYGPGPGSLFSPLFGQEVSSGVGEAVALADPGRFNPYLGTEIDQNTQISLTLQNTDVVPFPLRVWFTTETIRGGPEPRFDG